MTETESITGSLSHARIRLMIVDTHSLVRWAMRQLCESCEGLEVVAEAEGAELAMAQAVALRPTVVAVDCPADDAPEWDLISRLRAFDPSIGIVAYTSRPTDDLLWRALQSGASAYLPKSAPVDQMVAAIRHSAASPQSFTATGLADALARRATAPAPTTSELSPREQQILVLLHDGKSVPAIAAELYVSLSTAKTYVARLYDKLGAHNRSQALMTAVRRGLLAEHVAIAV